MLSSNVIAATKQSYFGDDAPVTVIRGSGKAAVSDLASRVVSSRIPKSFGGEIISELVGQAVDAIPFEFKICK
jgi:hypothetical protein